MKDWSETELIDAVANGMRETLLIANLDTLAEFADQPEAVVSTDLRIELSVAAASFALVAVVSGRPSAEQAELIRVPALLYGGQHSAEVTCRGRTLYRHNEFFERAALVQNLIADIQPWLSVLGMNVQPQGAIRTIHYGEATPGQVGRFTDLATRLAESFGIKAVPLTGYLDLRPASVSQGVLVSMLCTETTHDGRLAEIAAMPPIRRAIAIGGDAEAWEALKRLEADGLLDAVWRVGVLHEGQVAIEENADLTVPGVDGLAELLRLLNSRA